MIHLLTDVLDQAKRRGATAADAFVVEDQAFSAQVRLGQVDTVKHAREQHVALRVFVGHSVASASASDLSRDSLDRLVNEAVSLARITAPDTLSGLPEASHLARAMPDLDLSDPTGHKLPPEEKIELARRGEAAALESDPRITNSEGGDFSDRHAQYTYASSAGLAGSLETSSFSLAVSPVAMEHGDMTRDSWDNVWRQRGGVT